MTPARPSPTCKPSSTRSPRSTTPGDRTARWTAARRPRRGTPAPRATPTGGLAQPHCRVRRDIVNSGRVTLRSNSRLHHIGLGNAHNGTHVLILAADLHVRVITQDGRLLRELTLDPTRDHQPRGVKPGPQPHPT